MFLPAESRPACARLSCVRARLPVHLCLRARLATLHRVPLHVVLYFLLTPLCLDGILLAQTRLVYGLTLLFQWFPAFLFKLSHPCSPCFG